MSRAAVLVQRVQEAGGHVDVRGDRVRVTAPAQLPQTLMVELRAQKADIVRLFASAWVERYEERAAIMEHDGGLPRDQAETEAFDWCIIEWINLNPAISKSGRCAWCGKPEADGSVIVPFGTGERGHAWLHHDCWPEWRRDIRGKAAQGLNTMGLDEPTGWRA